MIFFCQTLDIACASLYLCKRNQKHSLLMKRRAEQMDASAGLMSTKSAQLCSTKKNTNTKHLTLKTQTFNI